MFDFECVYLQNIFDWENVILVFISALTRLTLKLTNRLSVTFSIPVYCFQYKVCGEY